MPFLDDQAGLVFSDITRLISVGDIIMSVKSTPRAGFLLCDWSLLDETLYPDLFVAIGTAFNLPGDPAGYFRIPPSGGLSPMGAGSTTGYTTRALGDILGEETHVLTVGELAAHTHTQQAHTHTQDAHTHTQDAHGHSVTDPGHTHTQDAHTHTQDAHTHTQNSHTHIAQGVSFNVAAGGSTIWHLDSPLNLRTATTSTTATNQNTTATNQNTTAVNQSNTTGVSIANTTATNQNTTATNQATTAVNDPEGSDVGHNTIHPVVCWYFFIRYE